MTDPTFNPYHKWLGIPPAEQPPNLYRLLGVAAFETDLEVIEYAANRQITHVRSCSIGENAEVAQQILNELTTAKITLLNPAKKLSFDAAMLRAGWELPHDSAKQQATSKPSATSSTSTHTPNAASDKDISTSTENSSPRHATQPLAKQASPPQRSRPVNATQLNFKVRGQTSSSRKSKKRKSNTLITTLGMVMGGVSGVSIAVLLLWLVAQSDPLGLFSQPTAISNRSGASTTDQTRANNRPTSSVRRTNRPSPKPTTIRPTPSTQSRNDLNSPSPPSSLNTTPQFSGDSSSPMNPSSLGSLSSSSQASQTEDSASIVPNLGDILTSKSKILSDGREWELRSGESFIGRITNYQDNVLTVELEDKQFKEVPFTRLQLPDQFLVSDALQYEKTALGNGMHFTTSSDISSGSQSLHKEFTVSPYAALFYSFAIGEKSNDYNGYRTAINILKAAEDRIEKQQEFIGGRHAITLSSVYNNLAVFNIRDHKWDVAANFLVKSIESNKKNTAALMNAHALQAIDQNTTGQRSRGLLNASSRIKIRNSLNAYTPESPITKWSYCFDASHPVDLDEVDRSYSEVNGHDPSKLIALSTWCIPCQGKSGYPCAACRGDGMVSVREAGTVQGDVIFGPTTVAVPGVGRCSACSGRGYFDCTSCNSGRVR